MTYDLRARRWDKRMQEVDVTQGNPIPPDPYKTNEYLDSIYLEPRTKRDLLEQAAYFFISDLPFPPRMRSDFLSFRVTPHQFEADVVARLLQAELDGDADLPSQAKRSEVREMFERWMMQEFKTPLTMERIKESRHFTLLDKSHYMQLYQVPLKSPSAPSKAQHDSEARPPSSGARAQVPANLYGDESSYKSFPNIGDAIHIPKL